MEMLTTPKPASELELVRAAMQSPVIFIPTMGALHEGHAALIRHGASLSRSVIVSIFVNPLQFEDANDLAKYPKQLESDRKIARDAGADFVWAPTFEDVYPGEIEKVPAGRIGTILEGASRSGHFDGVLTVVKRLFESVAPDIAIFGEKDFQQLFLIKQLAKEMGVEIIAHPTVRDEYGLALSSRNARLSSEGKAIAGVIHRALIEASRSTQPKAAMHRLLESQTGFTLDYAEVIDETSFELVSDENQDPTINRRALIAGWVEGVRLIDNMAIASSS
jgi:pantoate--beta-alanine ligase